MNINNESKPITTKEEFNTVFGKIAQEIKSDLETKYNLKFYWTGRLVPSPIDKEMYLPEMALIYTEQDLK